MNKKSYSLCMEITPEYLRWLREQRKMTRDELAKELDCSASAIVQWEGGTRSIPSWVADKMFSKLPVTFSVQELAEMYDICRAENCTMGELIQDSVHLLIEQHRAHQERVKFSRQVLASPPKPRVSTTANLQDSTPECQTIPAATATSTNTSPTNPPPPKIVNIVRLPQPPALATAGQWSLNETPTSPRVTEDRKPTTYPKPRRKKSS